MAGQNDCPTVWWSNVYFDRLRVIQWGSGSVTLIHTFQTAHYRIILFYTISLKIPYKIILNYEFVLMYYFLHFSNLKKKSNSLRTFWSALSALISNPLSHQIIPNLSKKKKHWTIQLRDNRSIDPTFHRIILKIVGF